VIAAIASIPSIVLPRAFIRPGEDLSSDAVAIITAIYIAMGIEIGVLTVIIMLAARG
jgi:hypothetical protein